MPVLKPAEVIRILVNEAGFVVHHVTGSHYFLKHADGRRVPVPYHNKDLKKGTLHSIIKKAGPSREEFLKLL